MEELGGLVELGRLAWGAWGLELGLEPGDLGLGVGRGGVWGLEPGAWGRLGLGRNLGLGCGESRAQNGLALWLSVVKRRIQSLKIVVLAS